jgi:curli biogenesis system outer membrane secretion channel CsgG
MTLAHGRLFCLVMIVALSAFLTGCVSSGDPYFTETQTDANVYVAPAQAQVRKVAILPFKAPTELIGASVSDMFVTECLRAGRYELVERGQMSQVLSEAELTLAGLSASKAAEVGNMLGADAVMIGTVDEYGTVANRGRTFPVVGISTRLIDCESGKILWSVDLAERGQSATGTLPQHARKVVHAMMAALYQQWNP